MAKTTYSREELDRQLSESRREFWAADATINNLELKLADMAAQLANAEKRIAELEALTAPQLPQPAVPECYQRLLHHAYGMTIGHDWNKGTMAGHHREKLCKAVEDCRAAMLHGDEPVTDNTNQQFESLSRGDK